MHFLRIGTVVIDGIGRDSLAKIRLEAVDTHIKQDFQLILEPFPCCGIRKIYDRHAWLPHIPLPYLSIRTSDKVAFCHAFLEKNGFLANIRVDPHTDI